MSRAKTDSFFIVPLQQNLVTSGYQYKPKDTILVSKPGADDYVCDLANPQMLRDEGISIPSFEKSKTEPKPESKKKK